MRQRTNTDLFLRLEVHTADWVPPDTVYLVDSYDGEVRVHKIFRIAVPDRPMLKIGDWPWPDRE